MFWLDIAWPGTLFKIDAVPGTSILYFLYFNWMGTMAREVPMVLIN